MQHSLTNRAAFAHVQSAPAASTAELAHIRTFVGSVLTAQDVLRMTIVRRAVEAGYYSDRVVQS